MKIALDPYMFRALPLDEMVRTVAYLGYQYIELSPRDDFMPFFLHPRADDERVADLKNSLRRHGVQLSSVLPLYKWSSPDETERQAAVRYWKRMIEITAELGCPLMNSEFNGRPERAAESEAAFWRSMEELLPVFEREGIALNLEAHPDDFWRPGFSRSWRRSPGASADRSYPAYSPGRCERIRCPVARQPGAPSGCSPTGAMAMTSTAACWGSGTSNPHRPP
jgi:hypothetical protein